MELRGKTYKEMLSIWKENKVHDYVTCDFCNKDIMFSFSNGGYTPNVGWETDYTICYKCFMSQRKAIPYMSDFDPKDFQKFCETNDL